MKDWQETRPIEERVAAVDSWIATISQEDRVEQIQPQLLQGVLEHFGANFEMGEEELRQLGEYTNKARAEAMRSVWGGRYGYYIEWTERLVEEYESKGQNLPGLGGRYKGQVKNSGMKQFFGQLTALAAGELSFEDFKRYTEARALNGRLWQEGRKDERVRVKVPTRVEPIRPSSFPPGFPSAAWEKIKSWGRAT